MKKKKYDKIAKIILIIYKIQHLRRRITWSLQFYNFNAWENFKTPGMNFFKINFLRNHSWFSKIFRHASLSSRFKLDTRKGWGTWVTRQLWNARIRLMQSVAKAKVIRGMKFQTAHSQASGRATCTQARRSEFIIA